MLQRRRATAPFEAVIDSATGVGKTYILAGSMDMFFAAHGVSNKTPRQLHAGTPQQLAGTDELLTGCDHGRNFATPAMRAAMAADPEGALSRTVVSARVITGPDGVRRTELITSTAADRVRSAATLLPEGVAAVRLADLLTERGDVEGQRQLADAGDWVAAYRLAGLLAKRGGVERYHSSSSRRPSSPPPRSAKI